MVVVVVVVVMVVVVVVDTSDTASGEIIVWPTTPTSPNPIIAHSTPTVNVESDLCTNIAISPSPLPQTSRHTHNPITPPIPNTPQTPPTYSDTPPTVNVESEFLH